MIILTIIKRILAKIAHDQNLFLWKSSEEWDLTKIILRKILWGFLQEKILCQFGFKLFSSKNLRKDLQIISSWKSFWALRNSFIFISFWDRLKILLAFVFNFGIFYFKWSEDLIKFSDNILQKILLRFYERKKTHNEFF